MKKVLGVSIVAMLAVSPMMAHAARTVTELGTKTATANTDIATTSYVKGAYNAAANAINALITDTEVTGTHNYIVAGETVSYNLGELDAQAKANADAITALGGGGAGSVANQIQTGAQNADYDATKTNYGTGTIGKAIHDNTAAINQHADAIDLLNGTDSQEGSVAYAVKQLADGAVATNTGAITVLNGDATVNGSVDQKIASAKSDIDADIALKQNEADSNVTEGARSAAGLNSAHLNTGHDVAANLIKVAGNVKTNAANIAANAEDIAEINNKVIKIVSDWGADTATQVKISALADYVSQ